MTFNDFKQTLRAFTAQPLTVFLICLTDIFTFIAYGFYTGPIQNKISEYAILAANRLSAQGIDKGILGHLLTPEYQPITIRIALLVALFFIVLYFIYIIFQGTSWWLSLNLTGKKKQFNEYLTGFAKLNLLWLVVLLVYAAIKLSVDVRHVVVKTIVPTATNILGGTVLTVGLLAAIIAIFSYPTLNPKTIFRIPFKTTARVTILCSGIFIVIYLLLLQLAKTNQNLGLLASVFILFPLLAYLRLHIIRTIHHVHPRT